MEALPQSSSKPTLYTVEFGNQKIVIRKPKVKDYPRVNAILDDLTKPLYQIALELLVLFMVDDKTDDEKMSWLEENVELPSLKSMTNATFKLLEDMGLEVDKDSFLQKAEKVIEENIKEAEGKLKTIQTKSSE